ncbi:MAG: peptide chain release factor 2 [Deltaproteobacteria bacterium]|nr:MAG: peptide chain release factor 2 [Deltaproteobacteria bacterium]
MRSRRIWNLSEVIFDLEGKRQRIHALEKISSQPNFWDSKESAQNILREKIGLEKKIEQWESIQKDLEEAETLLELAEEEDDSEVKGEAEDLLDRLSNRVRELELERMLSGEQDPNNSIVSINAGAGGTEAQDWAAMLLRMYLRYCEVKGFKTELIDRQDGEEAGIKSAMFTVEGDYAYGYLKAEVGIHRLVRLSPFDAGNRRHTSFASVFVYPQVDDSIVIDIKDDELRIDTFRSRGAGGQHVNKTSSAVRITHLPTGIVVQCQNERSQFKNKATAMKVLRARLYERKLKERAEEKEKLEKTKKEIAWGSQIRSYILHPYKMVKDHRTNLETTNAEAILDGELDEFIQAYLLSKAA